MPRLLTRQFGWIEYSDDAVLEFEDGLPAFDSDTRFVLIEPPDKAPLMFLQSLIHPELCFLTLPVSSIDPAYRLHAPVEDLRELGFTGSSPESSADILCLAILAVHGEREVTANLRAPVVIHRKTRRARQVIPVDAPYSFEHPLPALRQPASQENDPC